MRAIVRVLTVLALTAALASAHAVPAQAAHYGVKETRHYYDAEVMFVNKSDSPPWACEAFIRLSGRSRGVHPVPVAVSFDELALMRDGVKVARVGYSHAVGDRLERGTSEGTGWFWNAGQARYWAQVVGIRVRYSDGYLSGSQSATSHSIDGSCS